MKRPREDEDRNWESRLKEAAVRGDHGGVGALLEERPEGCGPAVRRALMEGAKRGHEGVVARLLQALEPWRKAGGRLGDVLEAAADEGHIGVVRAVVAAAEPEVSVFGVTHRLQLGRAILRACGGGKVDTVQELLRIARADGGGSTAVCGDYLRLALISVNRHRQLEVGAQLLDMLLGYAEVELARLKEIDGVEAEGHMDAILEGLSFLLMSRFTTATMGKRALDLGADLERHGPVALAVAAVRACSTLDVVAAQGRDMMAVLQAAGADPCEALSQALNLEHNSSARQVEVVRALLEPIGSERQDLREVVERKMGELAGRNEEAAAVLREWLQRGCNCAGAGEEADQ